MAEKKDRTDHSSAHPKDWPGIPGRSAEHEREPEAPRQGGSADVTEQQRELERQAPRPDQP